MGFVANTAITADSDLLKYAFEQQIANLLRGGNTYTELHKGAVDTLIAEYLRPRGINSAADLAAISNSDDFKPALTYWVLSRIFTGQGGRQSPAERDQALGKASQYLQQYRESLSKLTVARSDTDLRPQRRRLPVAVNVDAGTMFPALGSLVGRPTQVAGSEIAGFDQLIIDGK